MPSIRAYSTRVSQLTALHVAFQAALPSFLFLFNEAVDTVDLRLGSALLTAGDGGQGTIAWTKESRGEGGREGTLGAVDLEGHRDHGDRGLTAPSERHLAATHAGLAVAMNDRLHGRHWRTVEEAWTSDDVHGQIWCLGLVNVRLQEVARAPVVAEPPARPR